MLSLATGEPAAKKRSVRLISVSFTIFVMFCYFYANIDRTISPNTAMMSYHHLRFLDNGYYRPFLSFPFLYLLFSLRVSLRTYIKEYVKFKSVMCQDSLEMSFAELIQIMLGYVVKL